jgi:4-carboxymuconolactone decarboxylase
MSRMWQNIGWIGLMSAGLAAAQTQIPQDLKLKGDRFRPLTSQELTAEQKTMLTHTLANQSSLAGPTNIMLRSPVVGDLAYQMYTELRTHSPLPRKLHEFAVMMVAREWTVQFQWYVHSRAAIQAGLSKEVADAVQAGKRPTGMKPDEEAIYNFCDELLKAKHVSDATYKAAVDQIGEHGVVDLIGVMGYFHMVAMMLNVDRYPLPDGVPMQLQPLSSAK